jgi:hypothetical protein
MLIPNLIFVYHVIVASENLLRVAIGETREPELKAYFRRHLEEEHDHAKWLAEDLLCVEVDVARTEVPLLAVQMAGSLYYLIYHVHPGALLGYMRVLESWPMDKARFAERAKPYPKALLRTLNHHIDHDPDHFRDLLVMIEALPEQTKLIEDTAAMTRNYLRQAAAQIAAGERLWQVEAV